jgi:hypothetical protein
VADHSHESAPDPEEEAIEPQEERAQNRSPRQLVALGTGLSIVAHNTGVRIKATTADSSMAEAMVMENCR